MSTVYCAYIVESIQIPPAQCRRQSGRREWIGLAVIALPCLLYSMDLTVLHLAVPRLTADSSRPARSCSGSSISTDFSWRDR